ncbi:MAG TPA: hypothetical protein PL051_04255 [Candidatus Saccharibacteria bacterium]|nr:hypothetical protein [Candidatus Saccharibacteria bacterium]
MGKSGRQRGEPLDVDGILKAHQESLSQGERPRNRVWDSWLARYVEVEETPEDENRRRLREIESAASSQKTGPRYTSARQRKAARATMRSTNNSGSKKKR